MAKIIGGTAASNMLIPDWNQTNPNRADFIKNKPVPKQTTGGSEKDVMSQKAVTGMLNTLQGGIYIGAAGAVSMVTWERLKDANNNVTDSLKITIPGKLYGRYGAYRLDLNSGETWETVTAHIRDFVEINGNSITITIAGWGKRLAWELDERQLYIRDRNDLDGKDVVLMVNGYGTPCGGELMQFIDTMEVMPKIAEAKAIANEAKTSANNIQSKKENIAISQGGMYLGDSNLEYPVTWKKDGSTLEITIPQRPKMRYGRVIEPKTWAEIIPDDINKKEHEKEEGYVEGKKSCVEDVGNNQLIATLVTYGQRLVYNLDDNYLHIRNVGQNVVNDVVFIINGYGQPCGGELMRFIDVKRFQDNENNIKELQDKKTNVDISQAGVYIGSADNDYAVTWTKSKGDGNWDELKLTIPHRLRFRYSAAYDVAKWEDISANIPIEIDEPSATITISGYGSRLVFNTGDKKLYIRTRNENNPNDIVLMVNGWGTPCGGELMRWIDLGRIMELEEEANNTKQTISEISETLSQLSTTPIDDTTQTKITTFSELFDGKKDDEPANDVEPAKDIEPFIFFTDPHLTQFPGDELTGNDWRSEFDLYMSKLAQVYNEVSVDNVFCGGDWLGEREYPKEACYRLGLIDATMRKNFKNYHLIVGNHDTNYQGCKAGETQKWGEAILYTPEARLSNHTLINLWGRKYGQLYYKTETRLTAFYILDTNAPTDDSSTGKWNEDYITSQLVWLAENLQSNSKENVVILGHFFVNANGNFLPCLSKLPDVISAFNNRSSVTVGNETLGNKTFDFGTGTASGKIRFCMSGHTHSDAINEFGGIPFIRTTQMRDGKIPTFDLCLADYTNNKLHLVRIGTGADRTEVI